MTEEEKRARKREYNKRYYAEHKKQDNERSRKWCEENREKRREYFKRYYEKNREKILSRSKEKYWADPGQARERGKAKWKKWILNHPEFRKVKVQYNKHWRADNPDKARQHNRTYYLKHQDERKEYNKQWFRKNLDKVQEYRRRRREKLRAESERARNEKMNARRVLFESRLRNIPKTDVFDRIMDLLEWRRLRRSLR